MAIDTITEAFVDIAKNDAPLVALQSDRFFINYVPQKIDDGAGGSKTPELPYTRAVLVERDESPISGPGTVDRYEFMLDVFGKNMDDVNKVSKALKTAFEGLSGTYGTVKIQESWAGTQTMIRIDEPKLNGQANQFFFRIVNS